MPYLIKIIFYVYFDDATFFLSGYSWVDCFLDQENVVKNVSILYKNLIFLDYGGEE